MTAEAGGAPWARPDGPRDEIVTFTRKDRDEQVQLMLDLRRGLDLLLELGTVDPDRLGYVGGSYGGAMGGLLAGIEPRLAALALMVGDGGLVAHFTGAEDPAPEDPERFAAWRSFMDPIEPIRFVGRSSAPLLFQNGRTDQLVPEADAAQYHAAAPESRTVIWYDGGHGITGTMLADQAEWMAGHLGIDPDRFLGR